MSNPLFWILERLYYPKGTAMPVEDYSENNFYSRLGEVPEEYWITPDESYYVPAGTPPEPVKNGGIGAVDEYDDSAYFHGQLDEILAELRKLVKNTTPKKVTVGDATIVNGDFINPHADVVKGAYTWGEVNPRVYDNIVRGSN